MKYLLDTHILIWALADRKKLTTAQKSLIADKANMVFASMASLLEIAIKMSVGKLEIKGIAFSELQPAILAAGFSLLPIDSGSCGRLARMPFKEGHKDRFDRLLVAQAIENDLTLITSDARLSQYREDGLLIWDAEHGEKP